MNAAVALRPFPYPARAALTICDDIDNSTFDGFVQIMRFLNTGASTALGEGLELEIGDSFWMYSVHPSFDDAFTYFTDTTTTPSVHAEPMRALMQAGYLDTIHTWGNFSEKGGFTRAHAEAACEELDRYGIHPTVWANHDDSLYNVQRLGGAGKGHVPGDPAYHANLTFSLGVRFVWENLITEFVGQERPVSPRETLSLHGLKNLLLRPLLYRNRNWVNRAWFDNRLIGPEPTFPQIDRRVRSFTRYGWWARATADHLPRLLAPTALDRLVESGGVSVVYVHFGQQRPGSRFPLTEESVEALRGLAVRAHAGQVFVTTVSRLLRYVQVRNTARWSVLEEGNRRRVVIERIADASGDLWPVTDETTAGLTFYTDRPGLTEIVGPAGPLPSEAHPPDHTGQASVGVPWRRLTFPL